MRPPRPGGSTAASGLQRGRIGARWSAVGGQKSAGWLGCSYVPRHFHRSIGAERLKPWIRFPGFCHVPDFQEHRHIQVVNLDTGQTPQPRLLVAATPSSLYLFISGEHGNNLTKTALQGFQVFPCSFPCLKRGGTREQNLAVRYIGASDTVAGTRAPAA